MYRGGILQVLLESFTKGPGGFPYIFIITGKVTKLEAIYGSTFADHEIFVLGGDQQVFDGAITFEVGLYTIPPKDPFKTFAETLGVWYDYVTPGFNFIGRGLGTCGVLAVSPITDLTGRPSKSFFHLIQSPYGVVTIVKSFPEMLHLFLQELRIATDCFGPIGEGTDDTIFGWEMMVTVPL